MLKKMLKEYRFKFKIGDEVYTVDEKKNEIFQHFIYTRKRIKTETVIDDKIIHKVFHVYNEEFNEADNFLFKSAFKASEYLRSKLKIKIHETEIPKWRALLNKRKI
jgi:hypothetical protein